MLISSDKANAMFISFVNHLTRYSVDSGREIIQKGFIRNHLFTDFSFSLFWKKGNSTIN